MATQRVALVVSALCFLLGTSILEAQNVRECARPFLEIPESSSSSSTLDVLADETLVVVDVRVSISAESIGDVTAVTLESPDGTEVTLHDGGGGAARNLDLTYADRGTTNTDVDGDAEEDSAYDCAGCLWQPADGTLADFDGESSAGLWTLNVVTGLSAALIEKWCLVNYPGPAVEDFTCEEGSTAGSWSVTFTNAADYDSIEIRINEEVFETETVFVLDGESITYDAFDELAVPQLAAIEIVPIIDDVDCAANVCLLPLVGDAAASVVESDLDDDFSLFSGPFIELMTFDEDVTISDLHVRANLLGEDLSDIDLFLTSPDGTSLNLAPGELASSTEENLNVTFWDSGLAPGSGGLSPARWDCGGCLMRPAPGTLADFFGEDTINDDDEGTWTFLATAGFAAGTWTADEVGIDVFEDTPLAAPTLNCTDGVDLGTIELTITPGDDYDSILIYIDDELVTTLDDVFGYSAGEDVTYVTEEYDIPDKLWFRVLGVTDLDATSPAATCETLVVLPPIRDLACAPSLTGGYVFFSWTNGSTEYDGIDVYLDGDIYDSIAGEDVEIILGPFAAPTFLEFELEPFWESPATSEVITAERTTCDSPVLASIDFQECTSGTGIELELTIDVVPDFSIDETEAIVDVTSGFFSAAVIDLTSPEDTLLVLHEEGGPTDPEYRSIVVWDDDGEEFDVDNDFACGCLMQPQSAAGMMSFDDEMSGGEWICTISDTSASFDRSWVNAWCLRLNLDVDEPEFLRGDANGNGSVSALLDALFLLEYGFQSGEEPECMDAADFDGNNAVSPLLDSLFLLNWSFMSGDEPPAPGPDDCGFDDDLDTTLGCDSTSDECA